MKNIILTLSLLLTSIFSYSQDVTSSWYGIAAMQGQELRLAFNINETKDEYSVTMDSPDQGAKGIPVSSISFKDSVLKITLPSIRFEYEGKPNKDNHFVGNIKQGLQSVPITLTWEKIEPPQTART